MFRKSAKSKFNSCPHRTIKQHLHGPGLQMVELDCPTTQENAQPVQAGAWGLTGDYRKWHTTNLRLDKDEMYHRVYTDLRTATNHLAGIATNAVCKTCPFYEMTPLEVADERTRLADERLLLAQKDLERARIEEGIRRAHAEIAEIRNQAQQQENPGI